MDHYYYNSYIFQLLCCYLARTFHAHTFNTAISYLLFNYYIFCENTFFRKYFDMILGHLRRVLDMYAMPNVLDNRLITIKHSDCR